MASATLTGVPVTPSNVPPSTAITPMPTDLASLWTFLGSSALRDWAWLFVLGGVLETVRRLCKMLWEYIMESFFITAEFDEHEDPYNWMMVWLSRQPSWSTARNVQVSTHRYGQSGVADILPGEEDKPVEPKRRLTYVPSHNRAHYIWYNRTWLQISRSQSKADLYNRPDERLVVQMFARSHQTLDNLLLEAKRLYKKDAEDRIKLYVADTYNEWSLTGSRPKRPLSSVVLDKGVKERLLADARDFMASENWYAERGIPWRRGYLLYGCPGSGKTSLSAYPHVRPLIFHADAAATVHALAGELGLDIYVVSLSKRGLDDSSLNQLISNLPTKSLALMEDIDAAFYRGLSREKTGTEASVGGQTAGPAPPPVAGAGSEPPSQGVTLSGLLGAIDGVTAQEGRLLFATTNKYLALDPALTRPGRLDIHVEFELAGKWQAEELFKRFFPPSVSVSDSAPPEPSEAEADTAPLIMFDDEKPKPAAAVGTVTDGEGAASVFVNDRQQCPALSETDVARLAKAFGAEIPEREFSMAAIQGLLMQYKTRPHLAIAETSEWVEEERKRRDVGKKAVRDEAVLETIPQTPPSNDQKVDL